MPGAFKSSPVVVCGSENVKNVFRRSYAAPPPHADTTTVGGRWCGISWPAVRVESCAVPASEVVSFSPGQYFAGLNSPMMAVSLSGDARFG